MKNMVRDMFKYEPLAMIVASISILSCVALVFISLVFPQTYEVIGQFFREIMLAFKP